MADEADQARFSSLENVQFSRLLVLKRHGKTPAGKRTWLCKCSCGNETVQTTGDLRSGRVVSCGCFSKERIGKLKLSHGNARAGKATTEYSAWAGMVKRCTNPNESNWKFYGGRGIKVCERWINSFENFLADVGNKPSKTHSIDRINVDGDYEPSNCRWATKAEQSRNTRSNVMVTVDGVTRCLSDWCEITGVWADTFKKRVKAGIPPDIAITHKGRIDRKTFFRKSHE